MDFKMYTHIHYTMDVCVGATQLGIYNYMYVYVHVYICNAMYYDLVCGNKHMS
jgi:hypothetical protein